MMISKMIYRSKGCKVPKYKLPVRAAWIKLKANESPYVILKEINKAGTELLHQLFDKKKEWEERNKKEFRLWVTLDLRYQDRTIKQNSTVWVLVEAIWRSMEKDPPTEEEKYSLYLDLLEVYADKVKSRITGELRPIHISESNSIEGARLIDGLLYHLATMCNLELDAQSTVIDVLWEWEQWRGDQEIDPIDYADPECTRLLTEAEWRERRRVSDASGQGGQIERAHIVSRGADAADVEKAWNWIALTHEEHMDQHRIGWDTFLQIYPHLRGRVKRARRLAGQLEIEFKSEQRVTEHTSASLAMEAMDV
jgi:hypothetical protein